MQQLRFEQKVREATTKLRSILDDARCPQYLGNVEHVYDDKYAVVQGMADTAAAAVWSALSHLGVTPEQARLRDQLSFSVQTQCSYVGVSTRKVESPTTMMSKSTFMGKTEHRLVHTVTEHKWLVQGTWTLYLESRMIEGKDRRLVIATHTVCKERLVEGEQKRAPYPESTSTPTIHLSLDWLVKYAGAAKFVIDRTNSKTCLTPRRNTQVDAACDAMLLLRQWSKDVCAALANLSHQVDASITLGRQSDIASRVFQPILPFITAVESPSQKSCGQHGDATVVVDMSTLQIQHQKELFEVWATADKDAPSWSCIVPLMNLQQLADGFHAGVGSIEDLLQQQLIAAVGESFQARDFELFMQAHFQRLLPTAHAPQPFTFAVRREKHSPEGTISIEDENGEPAQMFVRSDLGGEAAMTLQINAGTRISFGGKRHVHTWLRHQFSSSAGAIRSSPSNLVLRARQFSCFLVVVGTISPGQVLEPAHALLVQDRDEFIIPLLLEQLPSARAFRDAIASLSPEQQQFAKTVRAMQLESSLFGVAIFQVKPQLEKLLNLAPQSLTKEIALTQQLMQLFSRYQIPADLLSYASDVYANNVTTAQRVSQVQTNAKRVADLIAEQKSASVHDAKQKSQYNRASSNDIEDDSDDEIDSRPNRSRRIEHQSACIESMDVLVDKCEFFQPHALVFERKSKSVGLGDRLRQLVSKPETAPPASVTNNPPHAQIERSLVQSLPAPLVDVPVAQQAPATPQEPVRSKHTTHAPDDDNGGLSDEVVPISTGAVIEWTQLPVQMDRVCDNAGEDAVALRPTKLRIGDKWTRMRSASLLDKTKKTFLLKEGQRAARNEAFDLLDALSRSGMLSFDDDAELHIVMAVTHNFDLGLIETVVQRNSNPIAALERSASLVAGTLFQ